MLIAPTSRSVHPRQPSLTQRFHHGSTLTSTFRIRQDFPSALAITKSATRIQTTKSTDDAMGYPTTITHSVAPPFPTSIHQDGLASNSTFRATVAVMSNFASSWNTTMSIQAEATRFTIQPRCLDGTLITSDMETLYLRQVG